MDGLLSPHRVDHLQPESLIVGGPGLQVAGQRAEGGMQALLRQGETERVCHFLPSGASGPGVGHG